jgi:hypothetical protein
MCKCEKMREDDKQECVVQDRPRRCQRGRKGRRQRVIAETRPKPCQHGITIQENSSDPTGPPGSKSKGQSFAVSSNQLAYQGHTKVSEMPSETRLGPVSPKGDSKTPTLHRKERKATRKMFNPAAGRQRTKATLITLPDVTLKLCNAALAGA